MIDPRRIIENTLIPHSAFEKVSTKLEQCFRYSAGATEPVCLAIVGESRTGKSRALEECAANHPPVRSEEGLTVPLIRVKTPSKPTVKALAELMLVSMGDPTPDAGTENSKTLRLRVLMRNANTRMVMVDEFQHFYDKGSHKVIHHVADWLKILVDEARVAVVVAGLPTCQAVLAQNEQLAGRFITPVNMPRFDWKDEGHREEFVAILSAFQESMGEHFDMPALDSDELAFRCYTGTGGLMGYLTKFLRQAVWNALDEGRRTISLDDLATAHDEAVWTASGILDIKSPFTRGLRLAPTEDLLARIELIGIPAQEECMPVRRTSRPRLSETVREVLCAS
ncbi:TniB family NTP-binding protein [Hydrogenophaga sp.]|uniref:TniB family NTP-binding protein n=1 Tax=Hydrogenophaga sp. TaxID=1904254 RepID=UPI00260F7F5A|nr:TniB family NTP-binding protein [Hydrogenophaga sp.]